MRRNEDWLRKSIMSDPVNRMVLKGKGSGGVYLVGGYVRDLLLGRKSLDRDFVVTEGLKSTVTRVAAYSGGKVITLGRYQLHRIILPSGSSLDFCPLTESIERDLSARDFTINSLAWSARTGLIDLHDSVEDLRRRTIRIIGEENIIADPLRILRAFRLADELGFRLAPSTEKILRQRAPLLRSVKSERITSEFIRVLNRTSAPKAMERMHDNGIIRQIIYCSNRPLTLKLKDLSRLQRIFHVLPYQAKLNLRLRFSQELSHLGLLRLEILLRDGAPHAFSLSGKTLKRLGSVSDALRKYRAGSFRRRTLFNLFEDLGEAAFDILLLRGCENLLTDYFRYRKLLVKPILSSLEIAHISGVPPGPELGRMVRFVRRGGFLNIAWKKSDASKAILRYKSQLKLT